MIIVLSFLINLFAPIVNTLGAIGLCGCVAYGDFHILGIGGALSIVGIIFGVIVLIATISHRAGFGRSRRMRYSASQYLLC